ASKLAPKDTVLLVRRGKILLTQREFDTSWLDPEIFAMVMDFANQALVINPSDTDAYELIGKAASLAGNFPMAKVAYDKSIELYPDNVVARIGRFYLYKRVNAADAALKELDILLQLQTDRLDTLSTFIRGKQVSYRTLARLERAVVLSDNGR